MKSLPNIVAIILIIVGIAALSYQGFNYTQQEEVAKIGDLKITANTEKSVNIPPIFGGLSIAIGIIILAIGRINKK